LKPSYVFTAAALCLAIAGFVIDSAHARQGMSDEQRMERARRLKAAENPLEASDSVWMEALTYMEVRDRIAAGATTAIIATGGVEENGPFIATGKHNVILQAICPALARELGNALCAPIVKFVPEGSLNPASEIMFSPGTFSVRDDTYVALLDDIATSLKLHGFKDVVLIGDSGGNQRGMRAVEELLNERWAGSGVRAHFIEEFYTPGWEDTEKYTDEVLGVRETKSDGHHDDIWVTAMMMVTDPESVRYRERLKADLASINGVDISDLEKTVELGRKMVEFRAQRAAEAIRRSIASR
jgi:creatinine amidohydrolase/Fe(II)-dependent formamide hydrolase-like protein